MVYSNPQVWVFINDIMPLVIEPQSRIQDKLKYRQLILAQAQIKAQPG